jgi:hypothetical protein
MLLCAKCKRRVVRAAGQAVVRCVCGFLVAVHLISHGAALHVPFEYSADWTVHLQWQAQGATTSSG